MSHAIRANVTHNMRMVLDEARESNHKHTSGTRLPKPLNCVAPFDSRGVFDAFEQKLLFFAKQTFVESMPKPGPDEHRYCWTIGCSGGAIF